MWPWAAWWLQCCVRWHLILWRWRNLLPELSEDKEHSIKLCFMPRVPCPLSSGTYPGASLPMSLAPSLLTPLTVALKIPAQSFIREKTSPKYGACGANAAWRATKTLSGLQQQQVANTLGKNTKKWTSTEQPPARYSLSTSSSLGTLESPVSYEEISQAKKSSRFMKMKCL